MTAHSFVLIASATQRSLEYLTSLTKAKLLIEEVFILDDYGHLPGQRKSDSGGRMMLQLRQMCSDLSINVSIHPSDVNSPSLILALTNSKSKVAVYSGYGGQIINENVLNAGIKILHIHSGALPEYRGSTTIYYAILNKENCGATAIILDRNIDTGAIVGSKLFPPPDSGADIDFELDISYRVALLVDVISYYQQNGFFQIKMDQSFEKGKVYYIAHPVLRHVAMLRGESCYD